MPCAQCSWTPPAGREDPVGVGVEEPPDEDCNGDDEEAKSLVAPEESTLFGATLVFGQLLMERLDAAFDHACALSGATLGKPVHHASV